MQRAAKHLIKKCIAGRCYSSYDPKPEHQYLHHLHFIPNASIAHPHRLIFPLSLLFPPPTRSHTLFLHEAGSAGKPWQDDKPGKGLAAAPAFIDI